MPLYSYKCPEHGEQERLTSINDRDSQICKCGRRLTRLMTVAAFQVTKSGRDTVLDTLNREHRGTPTRETMLMAQGLEHPKRTIGRGL